MINRRSFLAGAAATAALARTAPLLRAEDAAIVLTVNLEKPLATVPRDFTGLSYETAQLGHPDFFSAENAGLIGLLKRLSPEGVLRIGGNTTEYATWSTNDADAEKNHTPHAIGPDAGTAAKTASILTPVAIRNLRAFIDRTGGWRIIYGLNLWHGTPEMAAAEAAYVSKVLGPRLICFQIGNEPDMDHDPGTKTRWSFEEYWEHWPKFAAAVRAAVPGARLAGPDIAKEYDWVTKMAEKRPEIEFLSGHYYAEGPPANPKMTLEYLLKRGADPAKNGEFEAVFAATKSLGRPFRLTEGNSCFHGGKPLVSDTLASALWGGDYMLQVAQAGYIGVNLHGGGNGLYTPIAGDTPQGFTARPVFYGMMLAQHFAGSTMVETKLGEQAEGQNVTAFAAKDGDERRKLAIFNKAAAPVTVAISGLSGSHHAQVYLLQGPSIDSHDGVTLAGSTVSGTGGFHPRAQKKVRIAQGAGRLELPAYTAAYIEI